MDPIPHNTLPFFPLDLTSCRPMQQLGSAGPVGNQVNPSESQQHVQGLWLNEAIMAEARSYAAAYRDLADAVRRHRDERGDDRCWMDDEVLYAALPEGYTAPERSVAVELDHCKQFIACRQNPATEYVSPQRRIEELESALRSCLRVVELGIEVRMEDRWPALRAPLQDAVKAARAALATRSPHPLPPNATDHVDRKEEL